MGSDKNNYASAATDLFGSDEVQQVLSGAFYTPTDNPEKLRAKTLKDDEKPSHYKVICISMYIDDLQELDRMVRQLKSRGLTKANRSALIRYALSQVDLDSVPKGL